jgi:predicted nucleic acid-binding protein
VIYLDASVALAYLFLENRAPPDAIWQEAITASQLLEYEVWNRIHAQGLVRSHGEKATALLSRVAFVELTPAVLVRALEPFPVPVRTLDSLHLATADFLRAGRQPIELLSYDKRMLAAAQAMGIPAYGG